MIDQEILQREKIEQFKRDAKSVFAWQLMIKEIDEQLQWILDDMCAVQSPNLTAPKGSPATNSSKNAKFYGLMGEAEQLKSRQKELQQKINEVHGVLNEISSVKDRDLIKRIYIDRSQPEQVAAVYHFERRTMYKHIDKVLRKLFE